MWLMVVWHLIGRFRVWLMVVWHLIAWLRVLWSLERLITMLS